MVMRDRIALFDSHTPDEEWHEELPPFPPPHHDTQNFQPKNQIDHCVATQRESLSLYPTGLHVELNILH